MSVNTNVYIGWFVKFDTDIEPYKILDDVYEYTSFDVDGLVMLHHEDKICSFNEYDYHALEEFDNDYVDFDVFKKDRRRQPNYVKEFVDNVNKVFPNTATAFFGVFKWYY